MTYNYKIGVFAIIFDEYERVLLCHRRDYDLWNLPGGGLEEKEAPWEGVIREIKEETGLDAEVKRLSGIYFKPNSNEIVFAFICKVVGGKISLSDEADQIEYFNIKDIPKNTSPKQIERIYDTLANQDNVILKVQTGPSSVELIRKGKL